MDWTDFVRKAEEYLASIMGAEGFKEGIFRSKMISEDSDIGTLEALPDLTHDVDHGEIVIPDELLNFKLQSNG